MRLVYGQNLNHDLMRDKMRIFEIVEKKLVDYNKNGKLKIQERIFRNGSHVMICAGNDRLSADFTSSHRGKMPCVDESRSDACVREVIAPTRRTLGKKDKSVPIVRKKSRGNRCR